MVFNKNGIFSKAAQGTTKYGQAKARETLEMALGTLQAENYEARLSEQAIDTRITEEINKMGGEEIGDDKTEVIVDGYRFIIDRTVPKIVEELGEANGVIITAKIIGNVWGSGTAPNATVTGTIKTYSGGTITSVTGTKGGVALTGLPTNGGTYEINNITEDTTIIITATDSNGKTESKKIPVTIIKDTTPPTLSNAKIETEGMKIKISVIATDVESGVEEIDYTVSPATVNNARGTIASGQVVELTATQEREYMVTFTAKDNAGNITPSGLSATATTFDGMTVAEVKAKVNSVSALRTYIGKKVNYQSPEGGTWRVFYYDEGEFGKAGKVYLKRDYDSKLTKKLSDNKIVNPNENIVNMMKRMNPLWRDTEANSSKIDLENEKCVAYLCDTSQWNQYRNPSYSSEAIGSPSVEMYMKAYNVWKAGSKTANNLIYKIGNVNGYSLGAKGSYTWNGSNENNSGTNSLEVTSEENKEQFSLFIGHQCYAWLASPSGVSGDRIVIINGYNSEVSSLGEDYSGSIIFLSPVVPLDL